MYPYWLLFAYFAVGAALEGQRGRHDWIRFQPFLIVGALLIAGLIGFRYEVGGDWGSYALKFSLAAYTDLGQALARGDPGYELLNWSVQRVGTDIWLVNLVCGLIFSWGLYRLATLQPDPWLAFVVAVPYLVVVVAMGYSRQAVAIGVLMAGLAAIGRGGSALRFTVYVVVAALFHKTAMVVLPLVVFASDRSRFLNVVASGAVLYVLYDLLLAESVDRLVDAYIEARYASQGAAIRVAMNLIPSLVFLLASRSYAFPPQEKKIWRNFSLATIGLLVLLLVLASSTVVDRLALYIIPLQVVILSRVPTAFAVPQLGKVLVIAYSLGVQLVWLNFAGHAEFWIPYQFFPF